MQGDGGLAGAGAALHDEDAAVRGADDAVLLGLDGLHDVVHAAGAGGVEGGEQHGVRVGALVAGALGVGEVEDLVVQGRDVTSPGGDVAAPAQAHGVVAGGEVEGARHVGPPVEDEGRAVGVVLPDSDPADVVVPAVGELQPAETQTVLSGVQCGKQTRLLGDEHIALQPCLKPASGPGQRLLHGTFGLVAQAVEARVEPVDEFLLMTEFLG